jgi:hypothetical protein
VPELIFGCQSRLNECLGDFALIEKRRISGWVKRSSSLICPSCLLTNHNCTVIVSCLKPANANHMFRALADPTRRAISRS